MLKFCHYRRLCLLALLLVAALTGLGFRLVDLQVRRHEDLRARSRELTERSFLKEPWRGDILDSRNNPLATSAPVKKVCADPTMLRGHHLEVAKVLAPLIDWNETELARRLQPALRTNGVGEAVPVQFVNLRRHVRLDTWQQITQTLGGLRFGVDERTLKPPERVRLNAVRARGIFALDAQLRVYPNSNTAAHVVGCVGVRDEEVNDTAVTEIVGREGIEAAFNSRLTGVRGWRFTEKDRRNREIVLWREQDVDSRPGLNVVLTLDVVLQKIAENELHELVTQCQPVSASALIVRPGTGEILAMATLPDFDPNNLGATPVENRRNRIITDFAEPGSTFKIVVVSGALNEGVVRLTDSFDCGNGKFYYAGRWLHDHEHYNTLTVEQVITKSSNIGAALIGIRLGPEKLYQYMHDFGFGQHTGLSLDGETRGMMRNYRSWEPISISRIPMGHEVAVTSLQTTMAMCAIANEGRLMRPLLVRKLTLPNGQAFAEFAPQLVRQVIKPATAKLMVTALKSVVADGGTANKAALDHYVVAGKTGTAN